MRSNIVLQKNNSNKDRSDLEWMQEFHSFLQGEIPEGLICSPLNLTPEQSDLIIWYLQEHLAVFPDSIEMCDNCKELYNSNSEGVYYEIEGKHLCGGCEDESSATYCDCCMEDVFKAEAYDPDRGEYLCDKCKVKKQD